MPPASQRPPASTDATTLRLTFLAALLLSLFVLLLARLWFLQVMVGDRFVARAEGQAIRELEITAPRGDILDRDGEPLVDNRYAQVVSVNTGEMGEEREAIIADLASLLGLPLEEIERRIADVRAGPATNRPVAFDVPDDIVFYLHENRASRYPGVYAERIPLREYPHGTLAAHLLGYTGEISAEELADPAFEGYEQGDIIGWAGVERTYEHVLRGQDGSRRVQVNARGDVLGDVEEIPPVPGSDLQLTLDLGAQQALEEALARGISLARGTSDGESGIGRGGTFTAPAGAAVVLDPDTGEIVAMGSHPTFEPERFVGGVSQTYWDHLQDPASHFPLINRAIAASYPPGSVYKIISAAAALTYGFADTDDFIPCPARYEWNDSVYRNWREVDSGSLNIAESLQQSCDTVYYHLARQMFNAEVNPESAPPQAAAAATLIDAAVGTAGSAVAGTTGDARGGPGETSGDTSQDVFEYLPEMSRAFGLGRPTGIDLPGERGGVVPGRDWRQRYWERARDNYCYQASVSTPGTYPHELYSELCSPEGARWRGGDLVNMSIGQGDLQTTPLQIAQAFSAVATRGTVMRPHVVRAVLHRDGTTEPVQPEVAFQVPVPADHLAYIERGLLMVTAPGGTAASVFGDFPVPIAGKTGTAENKPYQPYAWFVGYNPQPVDGQRYVVVAVVERGGSGSQTAAPIVRRIFERLFESVDVTDLRAGEATD